MMKLDSNCPPDVKERVSYCPDTGEFHALRAAGKRRVGDKCGYPDRLGYIKLCFDGKWVLGHRLAWWWVNGEWPVGEIDHINGDPSDNMIENLRVATRSQNVMNTRRGNGVCWHRRQRKWQVQVTAAGKKHYLGQYHTREEADRVAIDAINRLHGEFANIAPPEPPKQEEMGL